MMLSVDVLLWIAVERCGGKTTKKAFYIKRLL